MLKIWERKKSALLNFNIMGCSIKFCSIYAATHILESNKVKIIRFWMIKFFFNWRALTELINKMWFLHFFKEGYKMTGPKRKI